MIHFSCNFTINCGIQLHRLIKLACELFVPFHYDPATKRFDCYPVCQEDVGKFYGLFNSNSNR